MKLKGALSCVVLCLVAVIAAFCGLQDVSGARVASVDPQAAASEARMAIIEAENCFLKPSETCWTEGDWILWEVPAASGGMLIDNENPPGSAIPVPVTLTLEFQGTGVSVVYRQDTWYGELGVQIDDQPRGSIRQDGSEKNQVDVCFEVEGEVTHTLVLTGGANEGVITLDAMRIWHLEDPCSGSLCNRGILVPAYFDPRAPEESPPGEKYWDRLADAARRLGKRLIVVVNIYNGPGDAQDPEYSRVISDVVRNGGRVIGYVYTCFGNELDPSRPWCPRPDGEIEADIDRWFDWYGDDGLDGIFFDEVALTADKVPFYQALYDHVQKQSASATVVLNFGAVPDRAYASIDSTILCTFEGPFERFPGWPDPNWITQGRSCVLVYDTASNELPAGLDLLSKTTAGWFYFTDDTTADDNPWDTLPLYFKNLGVLCTTYLPVVFRGLGPDGRCQISFDPPAPAETDAIEVTVSGVWGDSCVPLYESHQVLGNLVRVDLVHDYPPATYCIDVLTPWEYAVQVGPFASGNYQTRAYINNSLCSAASFIVGSQ